MICEGKKYSSGRSKPTPKPRLEIEKAVAFLGLGLGKDQPLQLLSNALKTYNSSFL